MSDIKVIPEPSLYLDRLNTLLNSKRKELTCEAAELQRICEKITCNIDLYKQEVSHLEMAKSKLESERDRMKNKSELNEKISELEKEIDNIQIDINKKIEHIKDLEEKIKEKEKNWIKIKKHAVSELTDYEKNKLIPLLEELKSRMNDIQSALEASNDLLKIDCSSSISSGPFSTIHEVNKMGEVNLFNEKKSDEDDDDEIKDVSEEEDSEEESDN